MHVVVCGGGIIGASTAYFLSQRGAQVTVVECNDVACAASGKSGGFLALDWNDHSPLSKLSRRSFALHEHLAERHSQDWGYRRLDTLSVAASELRAIDGGKQQDLPAWIAEGAVLQGYLGTPQTTAQVNPAEFTRAMVKIAVDNGAELVVGDVESIGLSPEGNRISGARIDGRSMAADAVVVAMGPWSILAQNWLPLPPVYGLKGNSIVFRPQEPVSAHAIFADVESSDAGVLSPEIYPRPDGTIYVCGLSSQEPLPVNPKEIFPEKDRIDRLRMAATAVVPSLHQADVVVEQACFRPVTGDGLPLIGPVGNIDGAYIATGHSVWGILNAPATGEALAQLILDGVSDIDLTPFRPSRMN